MIGLLERLVELFNDWVYRDFRGKPVVFDDDEFAAQPVDIESQQEVTAPCQACAMLTAHGHDIIGLHDQLTDPAEGWDRPETSAGSELRAHNSADRPAPGVDTSPIASGNGTPQNPSGAGHPPLLESTIKRLNAQYPPEPPLTDYELIGLRQLLDAQRKPAK